MAYVVMAPDSRSAAAWPMVPKSAARCSAVSPCRYSGALRYAKERDEAHRVAMASAGLWRACAYQRQGARSKDPSDLYS